MTNPSPDSAVFHSRAYQYKRERMIFARDVYILAVILSLLSTLQWFAINFVDELTDFVSDFDEIWSGFLGLALILIAIFVFVESIRFMFPLNWILALLIVESITLGLAAVFIEMEKIYVLIAIGVVTILMIIVVAIAVFIKTDLTLNIVILLMLAIMFFLGSVFSATVYMALKPSYMLLIYGACISGIILLFVAYHAQTVNGFRYAEMRLEDYVLAALILYVDFVMLIMILYLCLNGFAEEDARHHPVSPEIAKILLECDGVGDKRKININRKNLLKSIANSQI